MNKVIIPITPDKLPDGSPACGFDEFKQLVLWRAEDPSEPDRLVGRMIADVRAKTCPICQKGWENTAASLSNQEFFHTMERHVHRTCSNGRAHVNNFFYWHDLVCDMERPKDNPSLKFEEVPNRYGSSWTGPWYKVTYAHCPQHSFILGSRKRVFHMETTNVSKDHAWLMDFSFKAEDVTKYWDLPNETFVIHAWTREKAKQYLTTMLHLANCWQTELERVKAEQPAT